MHSTLSLKQILLLSLSLCSIVSTSPVRLSSRLNNGLAITPPLGWNTYNHYSCAPNETIVHSNALALVALGLHALGYEYVMVDCGWTLPNRSAAGALTWNPARFPSGYPALGTFVHGLGLKFGVYSDGGIENCMTGSPVQAGSLGHETQDAETFAAWGADMLKYDNCYSDAAAGYPDADYTPDTSPSGRYATMSSALAATGHPFLFAICEWGVDFPSAWAPALGNTWRVTNDIIPAWRTIPRILNQVVPQTSYAGPEHWLDLDMLEVGNDVFNIPEEQTHYSLWAITKSPLIIGAALADAYASISPASLAVLLNTEVISYNQDSLGVAASFRRRWTDEYEVWASPLSGGRTVVAIINLQDFETTLTLDLPDVGLQKAGTLKDIWNGVAKTNVLTSYSASVQAHGTLLLELGTTTASGIYSVSDATVVVATTTFSKVYGSTTSNDYSATVSFSTSSSASTSVTIDSKSYSLAANTKTLTFPLSLAASDTNTVIIVSSLPPSALTITPPPATFYPSTSFTASGGATVVTCVSGLCQPVGIKIGYLSPTGAASATLTAPTGSVAGPKFVEVYFCNNDIALATSWTTGTNTRNMTIEVNSVTTRIEVPLSGRSSELFSPGLGWQDTGTFRVLLDGFTTGSNSIVVSNVYGAAGLVSYGADFVGLGVYW